MLVKGTNYIEFENSGSWGASGATFPNNRGGLYWSGTSDWCRIFCTETASDNFQLIVDFGDDTSPSMILRDRGTNKITLTPSSSTISATTFSGALNGNATNVTGTVAIGHGGTGATSASAARTNLGFKVYTSNAVGVTFSSASTIISYVSLPSGINVKNIYGWCLHFTGANTSEIRSYITQITLYFLDQTNQIGIRMTAGASLTAWYEVKMLVIE